MHFAKSTAQKRAAGAVRERRGCRSKCRGGYLAGGAENIRLVVV